MMSRSSASSITGRASAMRRMRRRTYAAGRVYCGTNGCTSFLETNLETGQATCPICGYARRVN